LSLILIGISCYHIFFLGTILDYKAITGIKALFGLAPLFYLFTVIKFDEKNSILSFLNPFKVKNLFFYTLFSLMLLSGERKAVLSSILSIICLFLIVRLNVWRSTSLKDNIELHKTLMSRVKKILLFSVSGILLIFLCFKSSNIQLLIINIADGLKTSQYYSLSNYSRILQFSYVFEFLDNAFLFGSPSIDINAIMESDYSAAIASPLHNYYLRILMQFGYFSFASLFLVYVFAAISVPSGVTTSKFLKIKIAVVYPLMVYCFMINMFVGGGSLSTLLLFFPLFFALAREKVIT